MKKLVWISLGIMFFSFYGCSDQNTIPKEIIPPAEMVNILTEVCKVEARYQRRLTVGTINNLDLVSRNYKIIFDQYHISLEDFSTSYSFYGNKPEILQEIYDSVIVRLTQEQALLEQQSPDSLQKELNYE